MNYVAVGFDSCTIQAHDLSHRLLSPMTDRQLIEAKHQRRQEAAEALESMFPGLGGADSKSSSNSVTDFRVIEMLSETAFYERAGRYQLQRSDHSDESLPSYILESWQGKNIGFSASDIRKISVPEIEIVLDFDYAGFPTIEKSSD